jgi:hypothetical protein
VLLALVIGMIAAAAVSYLVGLVALRRTGIYFAMITVAIAEVFFFVEFNPLSAFTGGENGLPGVPMPSFNLGFATLRFSDGWSLYQFLAVCYFIGIVIGRRDPERDPGQPAAGAGDRPQYPRLQAGRLRDRRRVCRFCRRIARCAAGLHAAGRLHVRDIGPAGDADRDRRHRYAVRAIARRRRLAVSAGLPAIGA